MAAKISFLLFLSFLVLSNQLLSSECRSLAAPKGNRLIPLKGFKKPILDEHEVRRAKHLSRVLQGEVDSFRPTTPGHSPGMGHSKND
nr:Transmembrane protein [Ipomoea batatas]GMC67452.1 Transmembrane protein [Ipomoea batatas]